MSEWRENEEERSRGTSKRIDFSLNAGINLRGGGGREKSPASRVLGAPLAR